MQDQVAQPKGRVRRNRSDIRELLLDAAAIEFGERGFDGASTRAIAASVDAHQPQINYHFASKDELWRATVDRLFTLLDETMGAVDEKLDPAETFAERIRLLVRFAAAHPELNRIMVQEASSPSERMEWVTETYVRPRFDERRRIWRQLREDGIAAPLDDLFMHYVLIGSASLPYVNAPEAEILFGSPPTDEERVEAHAESLVATLLPGLAGRPA